MDDDRLAIIFGWYEGGRQVRVMQARRELADRIMDGNNLSSSLDYTRLLAESMDYAYAWVN